MDRNCFYVLSFVFLVSGCNEEKEVSITNELVNWHVESTPSKIDPFTKKEKPGECWLEDSTGRFKIFRITLGSETNFLFTYQPSNLERVIQDHRSSLDHIKINLENSGYAGGVSAGIYTHTKMTNAGGLGKTISENGFKTKTPIEYPEEIKYRYPASTDHDGLPYEFQSFCSYEMIDDNGDFINDRINRLNGCDIFTSVFSVSDIKYLIDESKNLNNKNYIFRIETYVTKLEKKYREFSTVSYLRHGVYDFPVELSGFSKALDNFNSCKS